MSDSTMQALIAQLRDKDREIKQLHKEIGEMSSQIVTLQEALRHVLCPET